MSKQQFNGKMYDEIWSYKFEFFQNNGAPNTNSYKEALKKTPSTLLKMRVNINFYAFFFGFIYFLIKGMFKGAVTLIALGIALGIVTAFIPASLAIVTNILFLSFALATGMCANYAFYRKEVLNEDDFNIFKGMRI